MSKYGIIKITSIKEVGYMDIHNIITIILTLTFFIIFSYYPKEAAKAQKISLLNMGILITILFLLIFIIKGYSPIVAMQNYELISPILLFGILNLIFLIAKYNLKKTTISLICTPFIGLSSKRGTYQKLEVWSLFLCLNMV